MAKRYYRKRKASYEQIFIAAGTLVGVLMLFNGKTIGFVLAGYVIEIIIAVGLLALVLVFSLVYIQNRNRQRRARILRLEHVDQMTGREFERYIGKLLVSRGYKVLYTPVTGDFGVDLIAKKEGETIAIQAKCYQSKLGQAPVREAVAGMAQTKCNKSMVVTNSRFTPSAKILAASNSCALIDRDQLGEWILKFKNGE